MKRVFSFILGAVLLSVAMAVDLPDSAKLTLVSDTGVILGVGDVAEGRLTLTLEAGSEGFITLLIEGADGTVLALDGILTATGQVLITSEGQVEDLAASTVAAGGSVAVSFEERIAQGVEDITALPQPAQDGIAKAISNHEQAMLNAEEGKAHAGEGKPDTEPGDEADGDTEEDTEAGVEAEVGVGVSAGVGAETGVEAGANAGAGANLP